MSEQPAPEHKAPSESAYLHIENVGAHKWKWVQAANRSRPRQKLAEWVINALNQAAEEQGPDQTGPGAGGTTD